MNIQLPALESRSPARERTSPSNGIGIGIGIGIGALLPAATEPASPPASATEQPAAPLSARSYSTQLNEQLTHAQQALGFVSQLSDDLQQLKARLSQSLSQRRLDGDALAGDIEAVAKTWQARESQSGGSVDSALHFRRHADARQYFRLRGIDLASLAGGKPETLSFFSGVPGKPALSLSLSGEQSPEEVLRQIRRALAPAGIAAELDADGQLLFSVEEAAWPAIRDRLSIKGGGLRFPTGQPNRLRADPEPAAIRTGQWQLGDHAAARHTLLMVLNALAELEQTRAAVSEVITESRRSIDQLSTMSEQEWVSSFAADFNATLNQPDNYLAFAALPAALLGVSRYRVLALLALDD